MFNFNDRFNPNDPLTFANMSAFGAAMETDDLHIDMYIPMARSAANRCSIRYRSARLWHCLAPRNAGGRRGAWTRHPVALEDQPADIGECQLISRYATDRRRAEPEDTHRRRLKLIRSRGAAQAATGQIGAHLIGTFRVQREGEMRIALGIY